MMKYIEIVETECILEWYGRWEYEISTLRKHEQFEGSKLLAKTQHIARSLIDITENDFSAYLQRYSDLNSIHFNNQQEKILIKRFQHFHRKLLSTLLETPTTKIKKNLLYIVMTKVIYFQNLSHSQYSNEIKSKLWNVNFDNYDHAYEFAYTENYISFALYVDLNGHFTFTGCCHSTKEVIRTYGLNEDLPYFIELTREGV